MPGCQTHLLPSTLLIPRGQFCAAFYAQASRPTSFPTTTMACRTTTDSRVPDAPVPEGFMLDAAYTWSKTMDNSTDDVFATYLTPRRSQNSRTGPRLRAFRFRPHTPLLPGRLRYAVLQEQRLCNPERVGQLGILPHLYYESPEYATPQSGQDSNMNGDSAGIARSSIHPETSTNPAMSPLSKTPVATPLVMLRPIQTLTTLRLALEPLRPDRGIRCREPHQ